MLSLKGNGVCGGIAIARLVVLSRQDAVKRYQINNADEEIARFHTAREKAIAEQARLAEKATAEVGEENAQIFEVHQMMLEDLDYIESIENIIREQMVNAEAAIDETAANFAAMFTAMDDEYMQARAADVKDISQNVLKCLSAEAELDSVQEEKYILAADDLAPSETMQMDQKLVQGFVTALGSTNSHTAILARTIGIPAVVNTGMVLGAEYNNKIVIIDGDSGEVFVDPDAKTLAVMQEKLQQDLARKELLQSFKGKESITQAGRKINVYANIGHTDDLAAVLANDAEGIGLFRSEFLYLERDDYPTEEQQFEQYKKVAEALAGKRVIIRTLDIGADKQADYFHLPPEANPALGYRAVRICLKQQEIFRTQLRAICRASAYGKVAVMFPMIIAVEEVRQCKEILQKVQAELAQEQIPFAKDMEVGIMIETPAAALISSDLAKDVDFFSIGTNDLSQYTLAIDRQNQSLDSFFDRHHPAVLHLINMSIENAHSAGIWCGICGELGADLSLTEKFLQMGVDELSVSPSAVLPLRAKICSL